MIKLMFKPFGIVGGLLAGMLARRAFNGLWRLFDGEESPEPDQRGVGWPKLLAALVLQGAIFRAVRGMFDRGARELFLRLTGRWPGKREPDIDSGS